MLASVFLTAALIAAGINGVAAASSMSYPSRPPVSTIEPTGTQITGAAATQVALSPVSNVKGAGFDRIVQIWLENTVRAENLSV